MPSKRRLVTSEICFGTEKAGLLDFSYDKCALNVCHEKSIHLEHSYLKYAVALLTKNTLSGPKFSKSRLKIRNSMRKIKKVCIIKDFDF